MRGILLAGAAIAAMPLLSKVMSVPAAGESGEQLPQRAQPSTRRFTFRDLKDILAGTFSGIGEHNVSLLAAGVAFYVMFAIFPGLGAATWVFSRMADPGVIHEQLNSLRDVLPAEAWGVIDKQLDALTSANKSLSLAGIFSLLIAVYSARLAASSMMGALNEVYGVEETRGFLKTNLVALLFTIVAIAVLMLAVGVLVVLPIIFNYLGLTTALTGIVRYARWPALAAVMALALALTYRYGPDRKNASWKWLTWGSATATILWLLASLGFSWYVAAFNSYDKVYGSIGAVVVLLFWFWLTAFSGLLGAELDNVIERKAGSAPGGGL